MIKAHEFPQLKERFRTLIREELALARFKEVDGDFRFRYEGMNLALCLDEQDPEFCWIAHFGFHWVKADDTAAVAAVDRCLNEINYRVKLVKLARDLEPDKDGEIAVHASISFLAESVATLEWLSLERYLSAIKTGSREFKELIHKATATVEAEAAMEAVRH